MTKIFSKFYAAVTFLCYFLLVEAKESKYGSGLRANIKEALPPWIITRVENSAPPSCWGIFSPFKPDTSILSPKIE